MSTFTDHNDSLSKNNEIATERLASYTKEKGFTSAGSVAFTRWETLETEFTTKVANGVLAIAAQTAIENT
jgi:hypothetical protein